MYTKIETPKEIQVTWRYQSTEYPIAAFKNEEGTIYAITYEHPNFSVFRKINDKEYITSRLGGHLKSTEEELELFKSLLDQLPEEKKKEVKAEYKRPYLTDKYTMEDGTIIILKSF